jgi:hypothetical protein
MSPGTRAGVPGLKRQHVAYFHGKASRMHTPGPCRFFSGSGANLQVLGGDEDLELRSCVPRHMFNTADRCEFQAR